MKIHNKGPNGCTLDTWVSALKTRLDKIVNTSCRLISFVLPGTCVVASFESYDVQQLSIYDVGSVVFTNHNPCCQISLPKSLYIPITQEMFVAVLEYRRSNWIPFIKIIRCYDRVFFMIRSIIKTVFIFGVYLMFHVHVCNIMTRLYSTSIFYERHRKVKGMWNM